MKKKKKLKHPRFGCNPQRYDEFKNSKKSSYITIVVWYYNWFQLLNLVSKH